MSEQEQDFSFKSLFIPLTTLKAIHIIAIVGLIVFANGLFNNFIGDDIKQIIENPAVHSITNIVTFFTGSTFFNGGSQKLAGAYYKPLLDTSFAFIYTFFGANYFVFHLFQILLYIVNACLLFILFKEFFKKPLALFLSLLFLIHPINSEVAFYISDTQDVLFFFFGIVSLLLLRNYQSRKALVIGILCLFLSLLSKETGILFICIALLYSLIFSRKKFYTLLGASIGIVIIYLPLRIHAIGFLAKPEVAPIATLNLFERLLNTPLIFLFYIKTFFFPRNLASSYTWIHRQGNLINFVLPLIIDIFFITVILLFAVMLYKKHRRYLSMYLFFCIWFFIGLLFHMQIFPLDMTVADRWFYFPIVGLLGMIGVILTEYRFTLRNKWILAAVIALLLLLSCRTFFRSFDWRDEFTLVTHDSKVSSDSYDLQNRFGPILAATGEYKEAEMHIQRSIQLYPYLTNYNNLGTLYFYMGNYAGAETAYMHALRYGNYFATYENIALVMTKSKKSTSENINFIKSALTKFPQDGKLWMYLAILEYEAKDTENARTAITQAYYYNRQDQETNSVYNTIMNDQPLNSD